MGSQHTEALRKQWYHAVAADKRGNGLDGEIVAQANPKVGRRRWGVILCTFLVAAVSYLDRNNISIAASSLQKEFSLTNLQLGSVFSAFILGYALTQP